MTQELARGVALAVVALAFGSGSFSYPLGTFANPGPGFFPLVVSGGLLVVAASMIVQARSGDGETLDLRFRSALFVLLSLVAFVLVSERVGVAAGTVALVFVASAAKRPISVKLNLILSASLVAIALVFRHFLGLNLEII